MVERTLRAHAGRRFNPYGEAAPKRGVYYFKTLAAALRLPRGTRVGASVRQGRVDLGVRSRRGLSTARGAAEA